MGRGCIIREREGEARFSFIFTMEMRQSSIYVHSLSSFLKLKFMYVLSSRNNELKLWMCEPHQRS